MDAPLRRAFRFVRTWTTRAVVAAADCGFVVLGLLGATRLSFSAQLPAATVEVDELLMTAVGAQLVVGVAMGLYRGCFRIGSFDELPVLVGAAALTATAAVAADVAFSQDAPLNAVLVGMLLSLLLQAGARCGVRGAKERRLRPSAAVRRAVVVGAGEGGIELIESLMHDPTSEVLPVVVVDDDTSKQGLRIMGVPVAGPVSMLAALARQHGATDVVVAIPSATPALLQRVHDVASAQGLDVKVMPSLAEILRGDVPMSRLRTLSPRDLLGRRELSIDTLKVSECLRGRRVLVTGAGGSIGSQLCLQIARWHPGQLIMLDHDESALHAVQLQLEGRALLDGEDLVVADIRDAERVREVFAQHRPEIVFHTAALKHLTLLERHPGEAVKSNVLGTRNVLAAAMECGTERFVNISTDKAAQPTSVLGWSKRIGERLTSAAARECGRAFVSVRFGNVLGSRGSVLTAFEAQIAAGMPLTVTHPDVTRYFMTVEEAVSLLLQAAAIGCGGEVLVLDMGTPVRIRDVATTLLTLANLPGRIEYTGLRPGEKLHEILLGDAELGARPHHPLITHATVPPLDPTHVEHLARQAPPEATIEALRVLGDMPSAPDHLGRIDLTDATVDLTDNAPAPHAASS
ncbi:MAG TPA: nucleoside-diphosphate sugar epimerase/dehydratase [Mycobacteriales bacterium]|nr:nucleoside-diphosphate sugar epimerase/dehydratase [Mycobacteriales bacterium]